MVKKTVSVFILVLSALIILLSIGLIYYNKIYKRTAFIIPSDICVALYSVEPKDFENEIKFQSLDDYCVSSTVDEQGNLVIVFNQRQIQNLKSSLEGILSEAHELNVYESDNFSKIECEVTENFVYDGFAGLSMALKPCGLMQMLNGVAPKDINVHYTINNAKNGKTLFEANWPSGEFEISADDLDWS